ncbi:chemotaxis protein CheW [Motiliproteus sp. MSK22-1]|uniref:chemotaxis protein CheW n=1 Tax=Motiliproteus sp. MSK22-1 TaxID=1897630 RepID=UPI000978BDCA|nr:chemotaxis protein CheW [Motiliproteus sp. MSK22-1]OMH32088.1 hypothetical protein BGP75_15400 [Motiliproteus sp. MSK22-1]
MEPLPLPEEITDLVEIRHGFEVGEHRFLILKETFSELTTRTEICAIPDAPRSFLGFINHRGETVPVFSIQRLLEPDTDAVGRWILLIDQGSKTVGILLDSYPRGLSEIEDANNASPVEDKIVAQFCGDAFQHQGELWREFDHHRFCEYAKREFSAPRLNSG